MNTVYLTAQAQVKGIIQGAVKSNLVTTAQRQRHKRVGAAQLMGADRKRGYESG